MLDPDNMNGRNVCVRISDVTSLRAVLTSFPVCEVLTSLHVCAVMTSLPVCAERRRAGAEHVPRPRRRGGRRQDVHVRLPRGDQCARAPEDRDGVGQLPACEQHRRQRVSFYWS